MSCTKVARIAYSWSDNVGILSLLAELMLPDGAHLRTEDWTVFYLNQTKATTTVTFNDAANSDSSQEELGSSNASSTGPSATPKQELLHVMSLVRTKHGAAYKRWEGYTALFTLTRN